MHFCVGRIGLAFPVLLNSRLSSFRASIGQVINRDTRSCKKMFHLDSKNLKKRNCCLESVIYSV